MINNKYPYPLNTRLREEDWIKLKELEKEANINQSDAVRIIFSAYKPDDTLEQEKQELQQKLEIVNKKLESKRRLEIAEAERKTKLLELEIAEAEEKAHKSLIDSKAKPLKQIYHNRGKEEYQKAIDELSKDISDQDKKEIIEQVEEFVSKSRIMGNKEPT